jgi:uncharacterized protein
MPATAFADRYGPTALVTGASSGIGRALACEAANRGLDVVLVARRASVLRDLADDISARYGVRADVRPHDLADPSAAARLAEETADHDIGLVAAAAGFGTSTTLAGADLAAEREMLHVNCGAVVELAATFGTRMVRRGRGGMILLSSIVAFQGAPNAAHYAATKAYVQTLAEGLHVELAPRGVDVLAAAPGPVRERLRRPCRDDPSLHGRTGGDRTAHPRRARQAFHHHPGSAIPAAAGQPGPTTALGSHPHYGEGHGIDGPTVSGRG